MLDGARVLEYAATASLPDHGHATVGGLAVDAACVAIAENPVDGGVFLLFCNDDWNALGVASYPDAAAAKAAAESSCPGIASQWRAFRELSAGERAEIETTRAFLRELASDFPGDR